MRGNQAEENQNMEGEIKIIEKKLNYLGEVKRVQRENQNIEGEIKILRKEIKILGGGKGDRLNS